MFAKVENGVTKSCQQFFRRKNASGKTQFWPEIFHFFEQDCLLFARGDIGVTESLTKTAKIEKKMGLRLFFQQWACASRFQCGIFIFLAAGKLTVLGGGYNFKTG